MSWSQSGSSFYLRDAGSDVDSLPPHVYVVDMQPMVGLKLVTQQKKFEFPYKIYCEDRFPERVLKTYQTTKGNLGILMNGLKGTGKTVQAEQICNILGLPVVLVTNNFEGELVPFLNRIPGDLVVFVDEYEKIYERSHELLTMMDGALRTKYRRVFLLTTNETYISEAMLNRPSRILYMKQFGNLSAESVMEIIDDSLAHGCYREQIIDFIKGLEIITVDIVKAICEECNRFDEPPKAFKHILNIAQRKRSRLSVSSIIGATPRVINNWCFTDPGDPFSGDVIGDAFLVRGDGESTWENFGDITAVDEENRIVTTSEGRFLVEAVDVHPSFKTMAL